MDGTYLCGFTFFANFDSGNLARIEVDEDYKQNDEGSENEATLAENITKTVEAALDFSCERPAVEPPCDYAFKMWTRPDCSGTKFENGNRTWFYFGFKGGPIEHPNPETGSKGNLGTPQMLKISIMNLNKQSKLFSQGMVPLVMRVPLSAATGNLSKASLKQQYPQTWERLRERPSYYTNPDDNNNFVLSIRVKSDPKAITYLAFTYPYSYKELQSYLGKLEKRFCSQEMNVEDIRNQNPSYVYFHRDNLCYSLQNRRIDLITISGSSGILEERESELTNLYPPSISTVTGNSSKMVEKNVKNPKNDIRPYKFHNKKAVFVSARVHPGETQSSFVMRGLIKFLLRPNDPRAIMLRKKYVFKLIPMLNPDGVYQGHYRTDSNGVNLNRAYARPDFDLHPSIYAARKLLLYTHHGTEIEENFDSETDAPLTAAEDEPGEELSQEDSIVTDNVHNSYDKSASNFSANNPRLYDDLIIRKNLAELQHPLAPTSRQDQSFLSQGHGRRSDSRDDDKFLEPSESLRIRRDSTRSGENIVAGSPCDSSPTSSSSAPSRWLRSHRKTAMEGLHSHSTISEPASNISSSSGIMSWYEMTETSRCSEGDESIADFSIDHPNSATATLALAVAVGANSSKSNLNSGLPKSSHNPQSETSQRQHPNTAMTNNGINSSIGSVGNSSSFERATSFEGAFSTFSKDSTSSSLLKNNAHSKSQALPLESNYISSSPVRRLTFEDDLDSDINTLNCENRYDMDEKFDSDDGVFNSKRTRAASSTSAFDQEEENANLDFATNHKLSNLDNDNHPVSFKRDIVDPIKSIKNPGVRPKSPITNKVTTKQSTEATGSVTASLLTPDRKESKEEKAKIYNSLHNKNKIKSNLFLYVDIHGHASKRGIFMYGNHFSDMDNKIASMLLPKLISINSANFDFPACNFTERNMFLKDRHTGAGREGSGRVSAYTATGLVQAYTLECNFNTGRVVNSVPMASRDSGRATPPPPGTSNPEHSSIPKYTPDIYEEAGKAMAISILDLTEINPWTRLTCSACKNIKGVKDWLRKYIRHSEEQHQHKTPSKSPKNGGTFHSQGTSNLITSPVRSLRSGSGSSRRIRTFSATSASTSNASSFQNVSPATGSPKWQGSNSSKKMSRGSGPGSPGSYRPVSKIARKNSLNQQQCQSPANFRLELSSLQNVGRDFAHDNPSRPKLSRSKSLTGSLSHQSEQAGTKRTKKLTNLKDVNIVTQVRNCATSSNTNSKSKNDSRSRSRSKGRASKPTRQQRSPIDKQVPTMKWSHNGTLITHSLPPAQIKKVGNSNKNRSVSANQKKRRMPNLEKSTSSSSLILSDIPVRGNNVVPKNGGIDNSNAGPSNFIPSSITNIRPSTSIDVEKQILSLTGGTHSSGSSVLDETYTSSETKGASSVLSLSSGIGSCSNYSNSSKVVTPKQVTPSKKRRIKRKKAI